MSCDPANCKCKGKSDGLLVPGVVVNQSLAPIADMIDGAYSASPEDLEAAEEEMRTPLPDGRE